MERGDLDSGSPGEYAAAMKGPQPEAIAYWAAMRKLGDRIAPLLVFVVALLLVFRVPVLSGFDLGFGDRADGMIEISILEHWRNVLGGHAAWDRTGYFYPHAGTLGYNDGYLLYGLVYSFWRLIADPFQADTLNILTFKAIGFAGAYALVARTLGWGRPAAALVTVLWTIASSIALQSGHAQLQSVALQPLAIMLAIVLLRAERDGRHGRARLYAMALAGLMAAWLITAYYMAWFTIFSAALFALCWFVLTGNARPSALFGLVRRHAGTLTCAAGAFMILIVPFLTLYLPKIRETGGQSYHEMLGYLVTPGIDMVNVGPGNLVWGWMFRPLFALAHAIRPADPGLPARILGGEHEVGLPPFLFALAALAAWRIIAKRPDGNAKGFTVELRAFALATAIGWLLTVQLWLASPWGLVFALVPGAKGIRVVSRYQLWLALPLLLLVAAVFRARAISLARSKPWLAAMIVALLVAENLSTESTAALSRSVQRADLWTIPPPPRDCTSFYVVAARHHEPFYIDAYRDAHYPHNVDAMVLAERWRVPTINGISTFNPPDWDFAAPLAADYDMRAKDYARRHGIIGLCRLDVRTAPVWRRIGR